MKRLKHLIFGVLSLVACGLLTSGQAFSQRDPLENDAKKPAPKPAGIVIDGDILVSSAGCAELKNGSISKNGDWFWVSLEETIKTELPATGTLARSVCSISANIVVPENWQYRVASLFSWYEGQLSDQAQVEISQRAGIQGKGMATAPSKLISGGGSKKGFHHGIFAEDSPWSPCGGGRNVNIIYSQILKQNANSLSPGDSVFETWSTLVARLEWRKC